MLDADSIRDRIRTMPDWPRPGVMFRDITPLRQGLGTSRVRVVDPPEPGGSRRLRAAGLALHTLVRFGGH